ncbi:YgiW/YdeI family stress tolerance OB fold protein [Jeongeupia naejangsanensis]|uniref:NirD/YgiW/YdeI family stress tolerance protein n=1 Tax=Jeongeupia naejangsanensis TaxID=613195 RepID=A0ABS2BND3_9NEIS|nr:NirD/YgiW/YdeI family stress tolerance protein [Jeongeupia naejangsanensis]MBM3116950.1 NirD/YgiW/YdeI family stress tolerance protein [Jeongeupia naejangsanensis]
MSTGTHTPIVCLALLSGLWLASAQAGYNGPGSEATDVDTAAAALQAPDKTAVSLEGYILRKLKGDRYEFRDKSGAIGIDIDEEQWPKEAVNDRTKVRVIGDIDRALSCIGVSVQSLEIVPADADAPAKSAPQKTTSAKKPAVVAKKTKTGN